MSLSHFYVCTITVALALALPATAVNATTRAEGATTVRGTVTGLLADSEGLTIRTTSSSGEPLELTLYRDPLTRVRRAGDMATFASILPGETVEITYDQRDGRGVARVLHILGDEPDYAPEPLESLEEREDYVEQQAATLAVIEEEIQELARASKIDNSKELVLAENWADRLEDLLEAATDRLDSMRSTRAPAAWERERVDFLTTMRELQQDLGLARAQITGR